MADPISLALTVASTAVSAMGQIAQGNAAAASYRSQAQAQAYNARVNQMNASQAADEYAAKENSLRTQQAQQLGRQRAALAESGIGIDSGTAQDLMQQDTINARLDDLTLRYEGQTKRTAYLNDASLNTYNSQVANMNAGQAQQAGYMGALGDVIGGASKYYSSPSADPWSQNGGLGPSGAFNYNGIDWGPLYGGR